MRVSSLKTKKLANVATCMTKRRRKTEGNAALR